MKKISFIVFIAGSVCAAIWAYTYLKHNRQTGDNALAALPDSCIIYLHTNHFFELNNKINSRNIILDKLKTIGDVDKVCRIIRQLDSLFSAEEVTSEMISGNSVHFAIYNRYGINWIAAINTLLPAKEQLIRERLTDLTSGRTKDGLIAFELGGQKFVFTFKDGNVLMSNSSECLDWAIHKETFLINDARFMAFKETYIESADLSVYLDHKLYSDKGLAKGIDLALPAINALSCGNVEFMPSELKVNGFIKPSGNETIALLSNEEPQAYSEILENLPYNTNLLKAYGFTSYAGIRKKIGEPGKSNNSGFWSQANDIAMFDLEKDFLKNAGHHLIEFKTLNENYVALQVTDTLAAREHLLLMSDTSFHHKKIIKIRADSGELRLFDPFTKTGTSFAFCLNNYLFFAPSEIDLDKLCQNLEHKKTLNTNESFFAYSSQNFPDVYNYLFYTSPAQRKEEVTKFIKLKGDKDSISSGIRHFSYSLVNASQSFKFRLHMLNQPFTEIKVHDIIWSTKLDAEIKNEPAAFINHNTGENELVVQDEANTLYLLNAKGSVTWRKKIAGKIISKIHTVDAFKNKKNQLLFNTATHLHMVDRLGRDVEGFPVKLPADATNPLEVIEYDGTGDYRLFLACNNNLIYNYSLSGARTEGFIPFKTAHRVELPVQLIKVGASDYLIAVDVEGKIYGFSRKGAPRINLNNRTVQNCGEFYPDASASLNNSWLVYVDEKNALINKISFSDRKEIVKLTGIDNMKSLKFVLVDENKRPDLLVAENDKIMGYDLTGTKLFEKKCDQPVDAAGFAGDEAMSLVYAHNEEYKSLTIFDLNGGNSRNYEATSLPLISELFKDDKKYMIIPAGSQLNCVLLNQ